MKHNNFENFKGVNFFDDMNEIIIEDIVSESIFEEINESEIINKNILE